MTGILDLLGVVVGEEDQVVGEEGGEGAEVGGTGTTMVVHTGMVLEGAGVMVEGTKHPILVVLLFILFFLLAHPNFSVIPQIPEVPPAEIRPPPQGCSTIFMGNLSEDIADDMVYRMFGPAGEIKQIRWLTDKQSGKFMKYVIFDLLFITKNCVQLRFCGIL